MKNLFFLLPAFLFLFACGQGDTSKQTTDLPAAPTEEKSCFLYAAGPDSTWVILNIKGQTVTGIYNWIPWEKDSARGTLNGTITDGVIVAMYDYVMEGSNQKEEMVFRYENGQLRRLVGELVPKDGAMVMKDPEHPSGEEVFTKIECRDDL